MSRIQVFFRNRKTRLVLWIAAIVLLVAVLMAGVVAWSFLSPNVRTTDGKKASYLFVYQDYTYSAVIQSLVNDKVLKSRGALSIASRIFRIEERLKPGRYRLNNGMTNLALLRMLRNGTQEPVRFTFNNINFPEDFCSLAGGAFQFDSLQMMEAMNNQALLDSLQIKKEMLLGHFLPNTYEIYWTISPEKLIIRFISESDRFWEGERNEILKRRNLTKDQVLILASIVQKETNHTDEMARMAGVYVNRLRKGMRLQADPTVKYAVGQPGLRRIRGIHLDYPSPYNTYYSDGLPPGVICAPEPASIDMVLRYEEHDYLYFCAKPGYNSKHTFAVTGKQHMVNAAKYRAWLRQENIF